MVVGNCTFDFSGFLGSQRAWDGTPEAPTLVIDPNISQRKQGRQLCRKRGFIRGLTAKTNYV